MRSRMVAVVVACGFALTASADTPPKDDLEAIKKQIQALAAGQIAIQKQLEEIRTMLKERPIAGAAAPAPMPARPAGPQPGALVNLAGAPTKGAATAKVTLVEISDFQCPFCGRFFRDTLPQLQKEYIDTGKVRQVFRNLPLESLHPFAFKASEAAMCADDQGKYWPMHDQLFNNQTALGPDALAGYAGAAGLDVADFQQCLGSGKHAAKIREEQLEASSLGIGGTPAFVIGLTVPGESKLKTAKFINGAQPYAVFKAAIDGLLAGQ
jgi:protein-disulfide isomerase